MSREKEIEERASKYAQYDTFANCNIDDVWCGFSKWFVLFCNYIW